MVVAFLRDLILRARGNLISQEGGNGRIRTTSKLHITREALLNQTEQTSWACKANLIDCEVRIVADPNPCLFIVSVNIILALWHEEHFCPVLRRQN